MTVRAPLSEVLGNNITNPSAGNTQFVVVDGGVEGEMDAIAAIALLGTKGDRGDPGRDGYTGSIGQTGSLGYTGSSGAIGGIGSTGTQGTVGFTGSRGIIGYVGSKGAQGLPGVGYAGSKGATGIGYTGSASTVVGYTGSAGLQFTTATNMTGGVAGNILIQNGPSSTTFIPVGITGSLLQYNTSTNSAVWATTATITVGKATNSDKLLISSLGVSEVTPTKYLVMGQTGGYADLGGSSNLSYHTNNRILSSPGITVSGTTAATSTTTGALIVAGGVGVSGNLWVGGTITAEKLVVQYTTVTSVSITTDDVTKINNNTAAISTITGALQVQGGVGIGGDIFAGKIYTNGVLLVPGGGGGGSYSTTTNLANGTVGQIPYQYAPGGTTFTGAGTAGQILVSSGPSIIGPAFRSTSTIQVGYAVNLLGGGVGYLPYQSSTSTTAFLAPGPNGTVLSSNGTVLSWQSGGGGGGVSSTATNIAGGGSGRLLYQINVGQTGFTSAGIAGQLLVSAGPLTTGPVYTTTSSITVGFATYATHLTRGLAGSIPYQTAANVTAMLPIGTANQVLAVNALGTAATWSDIQGLTAGAATTATFLAGGSAGRVVWQTGPGTTGFTNTGTVGQVLVSGGFGSPVWASTGSLTGALGYTGSTGGIGLPGYTGSRGAWDAIGFTGSQGAPGGSVAIGYTGSKGLDGGFVALGYTGSQGIPGAANAIGYTGSRGAFDAVGFTGSAGRDGYTGSASTVAGYTGSTGETGVPIIGNTYVVTGTGTGINGNANLTFNGSTLVVNGGVSIGNGSAASPSLRFTSDSSQNTGLYWGIDNTIYFTNNGVKSGEIQSGGHLVMVGEITAYSDAKLKENIETIDSALDKTLNLRGVYYTRKDGTDKSRRVGVIAQEIQAVLPEVVKSNFDNIDEVTTLSVDYGNITALLIEAIKELNAKVDALEKRPA
jgi:hypothetical protein